MNFFKEKIGKMWFVFVLLAGLLAALHNLKPGNISIFLVISLVIFAKYRNSKLVSFLPERAEYFLPLAWLVEVTNGFQIFADWIGICFLAWLVTTVVFNPDKLRMISAKSSVYDFSLMASGIFMFLFFLILKNVAPMHSLVDSKQLIHDWGIFLRWHACFFGGYLLTCFAFPTLSAPDSE
ncbi:MAG: hypothetical protein HQM10_17465 [Candidatus Riflebacteria bacterium]|nr:hypothetical protein [Candidatus Riflebacteria bacterium]